jgi:adenylate kinase
MILVITGIPGTGKTTVMNKVLEKHPLTFVTFGTVMFEIAKEKSLVRNRDELRKLPSSTQREIQELAAAKIKKMENVCVDTHCTIKTKAGYLPGLPQAILKILSPHVIILVEATPDEIIQRRLRDTRARDVEGTNEIREHQLFNRIAAMSYAVMSGATVKIVQNNENKLEEAATEILSIMRSEKG